MSEKMKLVVFGAGGFGREVMWAVERNHEFRSQYTILGYVDDIEDDSNLKLNGHTVVGNTQWLLEQEDVAVLVAIGNPVTRKKIIDQLQTNQTLTYPTFIASDVLMSDSITHGVGCIICSGNIMTVNIEIGDFCIINLDCTIGHDAVLKDFVTLYPSANISGNVLIKENSEIGTGTHIIQGKTIGRNCVIGAGTVVIKDISGGCTAVGNPARIVSKRGDLS